MISLGCTWFHSYFYRMLSYFSLLMVLNSFTEGRWIEYKGLWYYVSPSGQNASYAGSSSTCQSMNSHLAVITNVDQREFLRNLDSMEDSESRWIGRSNNKTESYSTRQCADTDMVWDNDYFCKNEYKSNNEGKIPDGGDCYAILFSKESWDTTACSVEQGYICQWECSRFYLTAENSNISGFYNFTNSGFKNKNFEYGKENSSLKITIYNSQGQWVINNDDGEYFHISERYVPYGKSAYWRNKNTNKVISIGTMCMECDMFNVYLPWRDNTYNITLTVPPRAEDPLFVDTESTFRIVHWHLAVWCFISPYNDSNRCAYIFPYPEKETKIKLNTIDYVTFTNLCVAPGLPFRPIYPTDSETTPLLSPELVTLSPKAVPVDSSSDNWELIVISVIVLLIVLIVLTISIIIVVCRMKTRKLSNAFPGSVPLTNALSQLAMLSSRTTENSSGEYFDLQRIHGYNLIGNANSRMGTSLVNLAPVSNHSIPSPYSLWDIRPHPTNQNGDPNIQHMGRPNDYAYASYRNSRMNRERYRRPSDNEPSVFISSSSPRPSESMEQGYNLAGPVAESASQSDLYDDIITRPTISTTGSSEPLYSQVRKPTYVTRDDNDTRQPLMTTEMLKTFSNGVDPSNNEDLQLHENDMYGVVNLVVPDDDGLRSLQMHNSISHESESDSTDDE